MAGSQIHKLGVLRTPQNRNLVSSVMQPLHGLYHDCLKNQAGLTVKI